MLAPAKKHYSNRASCDPCYWPSVQRHACDATRESQGAFPRVTGPTGVGLTAAREDTGHAVDETWLISHEDGDDMLLLALREGLGLNHVHIATSLRVWEGWPSTGAGTEVRLASPNRSPSGHLPGWGLSPRQLEPVEARPRSVTASYWLRFRNTIRDLPARPQTERAARSGSAGNVEQHSQR